VNASPLESYLQNLVRELRRRGLTDSRIVEEAREHLVDAIAAGRQRGLTPEAAALSAIARFGSPRRIAAQFMAQRYRKLNRVLFVVAVSLGMMIAYVDSRPTWDDTGITVFSLVFSGAVLGAAGPQRPWLWALGVGVWIPAYQIMGARSLATLGGALIIVAFPMVGAYCGLFCRRALSMI
jgi:hypothetical protein